MGAVSLLEWQLSRAVTRQLQEVIEDYAPAYVALAQADVRSAEQSAALRGIFTATLAGGASADSLRGFHDEFVAAGHDTDDRLNRARGLIARRLSQRGEFDDIAGLARLDERLAQIQELRAGYETYVAELLALLGRGDKDAFNARLPEYFLLRRTLNEKLDGSRAEMRELMERVTAATAARQQRISEINLAILCLAVFIGIAMSLWVTQGLVRPVKRLLLAMAQVIGGILDRPPVPVTSSDEIGRLTEAFNRMVAELRVKERIKETFGKYVDPRIVEGLIARPDLARLDGERRVMTISFCDMQGFTNFSEGMTPSGLLQVINTYLTRLSQPVREHGGVIDKYMGDAIMAYWGPPFTASEEQASRACLAALDQAARFAEFARDLPDITGVRRGLPGVAFRIGIATGEVVVGNIGSDVAKSYTLLGDAVNLASRLESANKIYGTRILASEATMAMAAAQIEAREIDTIMVHGRSDPQRIFEVLARKGEVNDALKRLCEAFAAGLAAYRAGDWSGAEAAFRHCLELRPEDGPARAFLKRLAHFKAAPPPSPWDGVWHLAEK